MTANPFDILPESNILPNVGKMFFGYPIVSIGIPIQLGGWEDYCAVGLGRARARRRACAHARELSSQNRYIFPGETLRLLKQTLSILGGAFDLPNTFPGSSRPSSQARVWGNSPHCSPCSVGNLPTLKPPFGSFPGVKTCGGQWPAMSLVRLCFFKVDTVDAVHTPVDAPLVRGGVRSNSLGAA